ARFLAPYFGAAGTVDQFGVAAQRRHFRVGKTVGQKQIAFLVEGIELLGGQPHGDPPWWTIGRDDVTARAGVPVAAGASFGATAIAAGLLHWPIMSERRDLFPPIEPSRSGRLRLDARHVMYWEESGNPHGAPLLFLHGGPGAGATAVHRRFFDPAYWRIVIFDQRGGGRSTPLGEIRDNSPDHLIGDIERLRDELGVAAWLIFGGS